ncbi:MAG: hypothetical protein ACOC35_09360, partial [Promethearchaeia archaeon]
TKQNYLSKKITTSQNISLSPALKEYVNRYIRVQRKKNPDREEYQSISAFYRHIMKNVLDIFERGKTLEDFDRLIDKDVQELFEGETFNATIPFYENFLETNRYTYKDWETWAKFLFRLKNFYDANIQMRSAKSLKTTFERMKKYWMANKVVDDATLEISTTHGNKHFDAIFEFTGNYKNLHYENCKLNAVILGLIGLKLKDFFYSSTDLYARYNLTSTDLFFSSEFDETQTAKLINQNVNHLISYAEILEEEDSYYLWMKLAKDNDIMLSFKNEQALKRWISKIESNIIKYDSQRVLIQKMLKMFQHFHWLIILHMKPLRFRFSRALSEEMISFVLNYLKKWGKIKKTGNIYQYSP